MLLIHCKPNIHTQLVNLDLLYTLKVQQVGLTEASATWCSWPTVYVVCRMAEAHSAVAFSFNVTTEGVNVQFNHEALWAVWRSGFRSWKKRIGRIKVCVWILIIIERSLFKNVTSVNCGEFSIVVYCCCHVYWKLLITTAHHCSKQNKFRIMLWE